MEFYMPVQTFMASWAVLVMAAIWRYLKDLKDSAVVK